MSMDLLPTILSVSETKIPEGLSFDGLNFSSVLFQEANLKERTLYWRYQKKKAARKDKWKLLITASDTALYDLKANIKETTDLAAKNEDVMNDLFELLKAWEKDVGRTDEMKTL
jgi:arylsulfatase A